MGFLCPVAMAICEKRSKVEDEDRIVGRGLNVNGDRQPWFAVLRYLAAVLWLFAKLWGKVGLDESNARARQPLPQVTLEKKSNLPD